MPNAIYPLYKQALMTDAGAANPLTSLNLNTVPDGPYCVLLMSAGYSYNTAHAFYSSFSGGIASNGEQRITNPTVNTAGTFGSVDVLTFTSVTGTSVNALGIHRHNSGASGTWKLVCYLDTSITGLPVVPNGGNITMTWHASGIFTI